MSSACPFSSQRWTKELQWEARIVWWIQNIHDWAWKYVSVHYIQLQLISDQRIWITSSKMLKKKTWGKSCLLVTFYFFPNISCLVDGSYQIIYQERGILVTSKGMKQTF